jgi:hypothetical protein
VVRVRESNMEKDLAAVEDLERRCQVGLSGDTAVDDNNCMPLIVEQVGDPLATVCHAPDHIMLVSAALIN